MRLRIFTLLARVQTTFFSVRVGTPRYISISTSDEAPQDSRRWVNFNTARRPFWLLLTICVVLSLSAVLAVYLSFTSTSAGIPGVKVDDRDVSLTIWTQNGTRNETAPLLGGLLFEDIAQSGDGGIYGELLRNRAFQGSGVHFGTIPNIPYRSIVYSENPVIPFGPVLDGWTGIGKVRLSLDLLHPLSDVLQVALQVDVPMDATGEVGIQNDGFWGIYVSPQTYTTSFHVQSSGARFNWGISHFDVSLRSTLTGEVWCKKTIEDKGRLGPYKYTHYNTTLDNKKQAPNINNTFAITFDADEARGSTIYFSLFSLFPETYKNRPNGLRKDLAEKLEALKPRFLRFPGGNNLEGYSIQRRWKWWKTIGPLKDRPGRPGDWTYYNTDGLGLLEYLEWCEDMNMEPLLALYDGFSLEVAVYDNANSTDANEYPLSDMQEVLDEAFDELEYCMGSVDTYWGRQRAKHGHPEPFKINMIQIGNEGYFSHRYPERANFMYEGLKKVYPNITYVFSAMAETPSFVFKTPQGGIYDAHIYDGAARFIHDFDVYDNFQPPYPMLPNETTLIALMEYHVSALNNIANRHPTIGAAVVEAVYSIAGERNPNTVKLWCFAPLMQNLNAYRGTPYNLLFTADPAQTIRSASYYQQLMFNVWHGTQTLPVTERTGPGWGGLSPLYWVASVQEPEGEVYLKVVNAGGRRQRLQVRLDTRVVSVNGTALGPSQEAGLYERNAVEEHSIVPKSIPWLNVSVKTEKEGSVWSVLSWTVPPYTIAVLQFDLERGGKATDSLFKNDL